MCDKLDCAATRTRITARHQSQSGCSGQQAKWLTTCECIPSQETRACRTSNPERTARAERGHFFGVHLHWADHGLHTGNGGHQSEHFFLLLAVEISRQGHRALMGMNFYITHMRHGSAQTRTHPSLQNVIVDRFGLPWRNHAHRARLQTGPAVVRIMQRLIHQSRGGVRDMRQFVLYQRSSPSPLNGVGDVHRDCAKRDASHPA